MVVICDSRLIDGSLLGCTKNWNCSTILRFNDVAIV
jgi:hypothetical protein